MQQAQLARCWTPDAELTGLYRSEGGKGPVQAGAKVCFGHDEQAARKTAHRLWPNVGLPGELAQILPTPTHFEQAGQLVTEDMVAETVPCGPDLDRHLEALREYEQADASRAARPRQRTRGRGEPIAENPTSSRPEVPGRAN